MWDRDRGIISSLHLVDAALVDGQLDNVRRPRPFLPLGFMSSHAFRRLLARSIGWPVGCRSSASSWLPRRAAIVSSLDSVCPHRAIPGSGCLCARASRIHSTRLPNDTPKSRSATTTGTPADRTPSMTSRPGSGRVSHKSRNWPGLKHHDHPCQPSAIMPHTTTDADSIAQTFPARRAPDRGI